MNTTLRNTGAALAAGTLLVGGALFVDGTREPVRDRASTTPARFIELNVPEHVTDRTVLPAHVNITKTRDGFNRITPRQ